LEALVHRHILLQNLLRRTLVVVVLASHEVDWIYRKGGRLLRNFARVKKCKGTGAVANVDVFEARALGWYLKPRERRGGHLGTCKRQPQLIEGEAPPH